MTFEEATVGRRVDGIGHHPGIWAGTITTRDEELCLVYVSRDIPERSGWVLPANIEPEQEAPKHDR